MRGQFNLFIISDNYITYNDGYKISSIKDIEVGDFINYKVKYFNGISKKFETKNKMIKIIKKDKNSLYAIIGGFVLETKDEIKKVEYNSDDLIDNFLENKDW